MRLFHDAQAALSFMVQQATYIEAQVYRVQYPDIQYATLIPVDTSGDEWAKSITFFSIDMVGRAQWFHHLASDMPLADIERSKFEVGLEMAGIGYRYSLEEIGQTMRIPGLNLTTERADAARRGYEEFLDGIGFFGDVSKGWYGLCNWPGSTVVDVAADGAGSSTLWSTKAGDLMIRDINAGLMSVYGGSLQTELADTVLLPLDRYQTLASTRLPNLETTALEWLMKYNVTTMQTGRPITVRGVRGLEAAGVGPSARMVIYRKDPQVLKFHLPMPHKFLEVWRTHPLVYDVPGIFRTGGVEIRRPHAVRYHDKI